MNEKSVLVEEYPSVNLDIMFIFKLAFKFLWTVVVTVGIKMSTMIGPFKLQC